VFIHRVDPATGKLTAAAPDCVAAREGSGPRHAVFHPALPYAYVLNELDSRSKWDPPCAQRTTVGLDLPSVSVTRPEPAAAAITIEGAAARPGPAGGRERILVVEDDAMVRDQIAVGSRWSRARRSPGGQAGTPSNHYA
jgi:Lactonase, 7-bladed beta-propeller